MRICLIGPVYPYRGGIAHYTTLLDKALRDAGHNVLLVSFKRLYPRRLYPGESDRDPSENPLTIEDVHFWIDSLNPLTWLSTFHRIRRYQPDVLLLPWWTAFLLPAWLTLSVLHRVFARRPLLILCHTVVPHEATWLDRWGSRVLLSLGTRLLVQSEPDKQRLSKLVPGKPVDVVPHPVYDMFAGEGIDQEEARTALGLPGDVPVLLFFGLIRKYKGLLDLLSIMPEIKALLGQVRLVVAGEFWEDKQDYLGLIETLGIGDFVSIEDRYIPNEKVPVYFAAADVLVAPYHSGAGSGVIKMAVGLGLPVVTTVDVPVQSDVERDLIHVTPRSDLARAIAECLVQHPSHHETVTPPEQEASGWHELVACITKEFSA